MRFAKGRAFSHTRYRTNGFDLGIISKVLSDALGTLVRGEAQMKGVMKTQYALPNQQKKTPWSTHQRVAHDTKG